MLFILLALASLFVFVPAAFAFRWAWRRGCVERFLAIGAGTFFIWQIVEAFYPNETYYRSELERLAGLKLSSSAPIIYKSATYPDHFGDYQVCFVVEAGLESLGGFARMERLPRTNVRSTDLCTAFKLPGETDGVAIDFSDFAKRSDAIISLRHFSSVRKLEVSWSLW